MKRVFDIGVLDTSKRRMVEGDIVKQIKDYHIHLSTFHQEIDFWFNLLEKTNHLEKRYFRKPICIELFEYAQFLKKIKNLINKASSEINEVYEKKDRQPQVKLLDKGLNKTLNDISEYLRMPRNIFAAHRYTDEKVKFITMNDVISQVNKLSDDNLNEKKHKLYECHNLISSWINKYETHLVLLKK